MKQIAVTNVISKYTTDQGLTFVDVKVAKGDYTVRFCCDLHSENQVAIEFVREKSPEMEKLSQWYSGLIPIPFEAFETAYLEAKKIRGA